jgi:hypothetical protein
MLRIVATALPCLVFILSVASVPRAAQPAKPFALANNHPAYKELRNAGIGGGFAVSNLVLTRDAAVFTLTGTLHLVAPVQGRTTGAVFIGQGTLAYTPPIAAERAMLGILTKGEPFSETFERAVFRFTDDTAEQIKKAATGPSPASNAAADLLKETNQALRVKLRDNLHARILHDVLSPKPGGLFVAHVAGKKYSNRLVFTIDPQGAGFVAPEEVQSANKTALTEAQIALQLFDDYFGPLPLKRVHMTQQTACNYGQAWPGVIYIPTCYYWGPTVRHQIGLQQTRGAYWDTVAPHEVAHLWWGHSVGWNSYRDQWMSEGFSNLSASLFLQAAYAKEPQRFRNFWRDMLFLVTERNAQGFRPIEVGSSISRSRRRTARRSRRSGSRSPACRTGSSC